LPKEISGIDPHFDDRYGILRNLRGFVSQEKLDAFESAEAAVALIRLQKIPIQGRFDIDRLRKIHSTIFGNIYPWAGEFRRVNMSRPGSYPFAAVQFLEKSLDDTFARLTAEKYLKGLDAGFFAARAAYYLGELNSIHPFREGNGRTQRELIRELGCEAGFLINRGRVTRARMYEASVESHHKGDNSGLAAVIAMAFEPGASAV